MSSFFLKINQASGLRDILQIRPGREQEPSWWGSSKCCQARRKLLGHDRLQPLNSRASQQHVVEILLRNSFFHKHTFFFHFIHSSLIQYIPNTVYPSPSPSSLCSIFPPTQTLSLFSVSFQKKAELPGILTEHVTTSCNKTIHQPWCSGWTRQTSRRKRVTWVESSKTPS